MGSVLFRNRYWYYKSLYDDYVGDSLEWHLLCVH